jgi:hypothetical protein
MARSARAVGQLELVVTMETACHGLRRSDPDVLPEDAPVRCLFHMSETAAAFKRRPPQLNPGYKASPEQRRRLSPENGFRLSDES